MGPALFVIAVLGGVAYYTWRRHQAASEMVRAELVKRGATEIELEVDWLDFDRDTLSYDVSYRNRNGERAFNRCKAPISVRADRDIYWRDPLEPAERIRGK